MEKAGKLSNGIFKALVKRRLDIFLSICIMLLVGDSVVKSLGWFGTKATGEDPATLIVLVLMWVVVATGSQISDENTLIGKLLLYFLTPKIEKRLLEVGTDLIALTMHDQSQPSTDDKTLSSALDALNNLPGNLPK